MLTDNEIKEVTSDSLKFKNLSDALINVILDSETPISIGIYGEWGSGKTSLMRITQMKLGRETLTDKIAGLTKEKTFDPESTKKEIRKAIEFHYDNIINQKYLHIKEKTAPKDNGEIEKKEDETITKKILQKFDMEIDEYVSEILKFVETERSAKTGSEKQDGLKTSLNKKFFDFLNKDPGSYSEWDIKTKIRKSLNGKERASLQKKIYQEIINNYESPERPSITINTVWFNAWKYDKEYDLRVALIHTILKNIKEDKSISELTRKKAVELLKKINWLSLGKTSAEIAAAVAVPPVGIIALLKTFFGSSPDKIIRDTPAEKTLSLIDEFEKEFEDLTYKYVGEDGKLVIFIDDLDRCLPDKAIEILESIKLFLNVRGTVFLIGADESRIKSSVKKKFGDNSENYLDKIIQVPFRISIQAKETITNEYIEGLEIEKELKEFKLLIVDRELNLRAIKRIYNDIELRIAIADARNIKIEKDRLVKFILLEKYWEKFYIELCSRFTKNNKKNIMNDLNECGLFDDKSRGDKLNKEPFLVDYYSDSSLIDFLKSDPILFNIDIRPYIYLQNIFSGIPENKGDTKEIDKYFDLGFQSYDKKDYKKSIEYFNNVLQLNEKYIQAYYNRGLSYMNLKEDSVAIVDFDNVIKLDEKYKNAYYWKAYCLRNINRTEEAIRNYDIVISLDDKYETAYVDRGIAYMDEKIKDYDKAIADFNIANSLNPKAADIYYNRALAHMYKNDPDSAIKDNDAAIRLFPAYTIAFINRALAYERKGEFNKALKDHSKAIELESKEEINVSRKALNNMEYTLNDLINNKYTISPQSDYIEIEKNINNSNLTAGVKTKVLDLLQELLPPNADTSGYLPPGSNGKDSVVSSSDITLPENENFGKAYDSFENGDYSKAIEYYGKVLESNPDYKEAFYNRGLAYYNLGDYDSAVADFDSTIMLDENYKNAYFWKANSLNMMGKSGDSLDAYSDIISKFPDFDSAFIQRGIAYMDKVQYDKAIDDFNSAAELKPDAPDVYYNRALAYFYKSDFENSLADNIRAIELKPDYTNAYINRGLIYDRLKNFDKALTDYSKAILTDSKSDLAYNNITILLDELTENKYDNKIPQIVRDNVSASALDENKKKTILELIDNIDAKKYKTSVDPVRNGETGLKVGDYFQKAFDSYENKDYNSAVENYSRVLELDRNYKNAYFNRGLAYNKLAQYTLAINDFDNAIRLDTNYKLPYYQKASCLMALSKTTEAIENYTKAIDIDPQYESAFIDRGIAYSYIKQYDKAIEDFNSALEINPEEADTYFNRALIYMYKNEADRAIEDNTRAIEINPAYDIAFINRALAYENKGELNKALIDDSFAVKYSKEVTADGERDLAYDNIIYLLNNLNKEKYKMQSQSDFELIRRNIEDSKIKNEKKKSILKLLDTIRESRS